LERWFPTSKASATDIQSALAELTGKSRGASTAKRTGKGAAIGAGAGAGVGAGSEIITKGDQVKVPSETLLDFTLQQDVTIPAPELILGRVAREA